MDVRFRIGADSASVDEAGLKFDLNDFDAWGVEAALKLRDANAGSEVTVISLGPDVVQETIRKALSMGVDRGIHLKTDKVPFDGLAIAKTLSEELKAGSYDLIFFGKMGPDSANGVVGPMTAELLGLPCVSAISSLDTAAGKGKAKRALAGAQELVEFPFPAVLTVDEGLNQARLPSLKGIMAAKKKPLEVKPAQIPAPQRTVRKLELPAERKAGRVVGEGAAAVPELVKLLQTEAKVL